LTVLPLNTKFSLIIFGPVSNIKVMCGIDLPER